MIKNKHKTIAIITSAGQSKRMGNKINKLFLELQDKPLLFYTISPFQNISEIDEIFITIEEKNIKFCEKEIVKKFNFTKVKKILAGGLQRQDSIYNAIKELPDDTDYVIIHDGARPIITNDLITKIINEVKLNNACIAAVPVKDTIKEINIDEKNIIKTLDRKKLVSVQTPQAFEFNIIKKAYQKAYEDNFYGTDDAMLVERLGINVKIVEGSYNNIKVTTPEDILFVKELIK